MAEDRRAHTQKPRCNGSHHGSQDEASFRSPRAGARIDALRALRLSARSGNSSPSAPRALS
eukprot:224493-Pyramimonas_sp.AAC.1